MAHGVRKPDSLTLPCGSCGEPMDKYDPLIDCISCLGVLHAADALSNPGGCPLCAMCAPLHLMHQMTAASITVGSDGSDADHPISFDAPAHRPSHSRSRLDSAKCAFQLSPSSATAEVARPREPECMHGRARSPLRQRAASSPHAVISLGRDNDPADCIEEDNPMPSFQASSGISLVSPSPDALMYVVSLWGASRLTPTSPARRKDIARGERQS